MLFIFRKIRRSFFLPGKVRTYVVYALGEVLLIVIGILIAVQIGEWREARKVDRQRQELIENLKRDFKTTLQRLNTAIETAEKKLHSHSQFLAFAAGNNENLTMEEAKRAHTLSWGAIRFESAIASYEAAKSTGSINLIQDLNLLEQFMDFEKHQLFWERIAEIGIDDAFQGSVYELRKTFGSIAILLFEHEQPLPEVFSLSEQEIRDMFIQPEVYGVLENKNQILISSENRLNRLKKTTENILLALENLD